MSGPGTSPAGKKVSAAWLILLSGVLLGLSYPPIPLGSIAMVAFVPFFLLFEQVPFLLEGAPVRVRDFLHF